MNNLNATLVVDDLHKYFGSDEVLKGVSLQAHEGDVIAMMGASGSGKSTLSYMLAGRDGYELESGQVFLEGQSLSDMEADERARSGLFLAFQYPVELPGVGGMSFLREAVNSRRKFLGEEELDHLAFVKEARKVSSTSSESELSSIKISFASSISMSIGSSISLVTGSSSLTSSSADSTNETPHSGHDSLSIGIIELQAPHSPNCSSETPPNLILQLGHDSLSSGTIVPVSYTHLTLPTNREV